MAQSVEESGKLYREALDASRDQREQIREDLEFSDPSDPQQWDETERRARENDPGGVRPCLVFDQTGQYVQNVTGQVEQQPPAMHAIPAGGGADKKVAEQYDGLFRHVEHSSRAQQHYQRVSLSQARAGVGYLIVRPEYVNRALNWQEPRISSEGDPLRVVFDPWSVELDGSDADFGFLLTPHSHRDYERQYGAKTAKVSFGSDDYSDDRESIIVAEEWRAEDKTTNMIICQDVNSLPGDEMTLSEDDYWAAHKNGQQMQVLGTYSDKQRCIYWRKMNGTQELSKEVIYPASSIGLVPVYGYVGFSDGRMKYCGIPRRARSGQRAYNFHESEMRVLMAQAAKSPYMMPMRALGGDENIKRLWDRASVDSRAYIPYNDRDEAGDIRPPERIQPAINLQNHIQGSLQARENIQAALGMYAANIGKNSNVTSGVAYNAQKQEGEASTANFPSHLSASVAQAGSLCLQMIPRLIDKKRQVRILGVDMTPGSVTIDPGQKGAIQETDQGLSINPNVGSYDVYAVSGASFATQRQESNAALTEMGRADPTMMPVIAPFWAQTLDFPNSDKLAQAFAAMAPPQVQAILNPGSDKQPKTADLVAQIEQQKQQLAELSKLFHEAQSDADEAHDKLKDKTDDNEIAAYEAETNRLKVTGANDQQIQAIVQQMIDQMLKSPDPMGDEQGAMPPMLSQPMPGTAPVDPMGSMPMQPPQDPGALAPSMQSAPAAVPQE